MNSNLTNLIKNKLSLHLKGSMKKFVVLNDYFEIIIEYQNKEDFLYDLNNVLFFNNFHEDDLFEKKEPFLITYNSMQLKKFLKIHNLN